MPLAILLLIILNITNFLGWNNLYFTDEIFGLEIKLQPVVGQLLIWGISTFIGAVLYEYWQRKRYKVKVSPEDTRRDIVVTTASSVIGFFILEIIKLFF